MNDPLSVKICHLDCLFQITASYNITTESAIKKGYIWPFLYCLCHFH